MRFTDKPLEPFGEGILDMAIPTQLTFKTPLVFRVLRELVARGYLPAEGNPRVELVLDEAITNALVHGNKLDPGKKVYLKLFGDENRWGAILEDEGQGFSQVNLPRAQDAEDPFRESGRGILLMDAYLDDLVYGPGGTSVMLVRRREAPPSEGEAGQATPESTG